MAALPGLAAEVAAGAGEPLWPRWEELAVALGAGPLLVCLDYDGTLVPIAPTPEQAVADAATVEAVARLATAPGVRVAVVSGRPVAQLRELLPIGSLWLVGTHGFEEAAPGAEPRALRDLEACEEALAGLRKTAAAIAALHPGVRVEDKGAALALHTRLAERAAAAGAAELFRRAAAEVPGFEVMAGKEVLEARPAGAHKGAAVLRLREAGEAVAYLGDDVTDEDAFAALAGEPAAVTVRVGRPRPTAARFRLDEQAEVAEVLARLLALRE
jgi:trehalose 6-phosphate phosphatase